MYSCRRESSPTIETVPQVLPNTRMDSPSALVFRAPAPLRFWHLASFDAPTVALVWSLAFAWAAHVILPLWVPALLVLAVWAVYVADRLLDARASLRNTALHRLRDRHFFHWRHRRILLPLAAAAASAAAWIIFTLMPTIARERNSMLAAASLVYFTRVHTGRKLPPYLQILSKELLVGMLFTAGCALPAWSPVRWTPENQLRFGRCLTTAGFFAVLAWLNCHAIDRWESTSGSTESSLQSRSLAALIALAALRPSGWLLCPQPLAAPRSCSPPRPRPFSLALLDTLRRSTLLLSPSAPPPTSPCSRRCFSFPSPRCSDERARQTSTASPAFIGGWRWPPSAHFAVANTLRLPRANR